MFHYNVTETSIEFIPIYSWWACVLVLQLMSFAWFTGRVRVRIEVIHSDEDRKWMKNPTICPTGGGHLELDHIRAGHFNDLALIILYLIIALIWLNTSPSSLVANILLRVFPIAKIFHSVFYMRLIEAPKILSFFCLTACYTTLIYMITTNAYFFYASD